MTQNDDLYRAIIDSPEDDDLRLVYADWLEEQGHLDRAEFLRLQIRLAGMSGLEVLCHTTVSQRQWLRRTGRRLCKGLPNLKGITWHCERGLPDRIVASSFRALATHGATAVEAAPVCSVLIRNVGPQVIREIAAWPLLGRFSTVELESPYASADAGEALAESPHLGRLKRLRARNCGLGWSMNRLVQTEWWQHLTALRLEQEWAPGEEALKTLAEGSAGSSLQWLAVATGQSFPPEEIQALANSPLARKLTGLDLTIVRHGLPDLLRASMPQLRELRVWTFPGLIEHLPEPPALPALKFLSLENPLGPAALSDLAGWPPLRALSLSLFGGKKADLQCLLTSPVIGKLQCLALSGGLYGPHGYSTFRKPMAATLSKSTTLGHLRTLWLGNMKDWFSPLEWKRFRDNVGADVCSTCCDDDPARLRPLPRL